MIVILLLVNTLALIINISIFIEYSSYISKRSKGPLGNIDIDSSILNLFEENQESYPEDRVDLDNPMTANMHDIELKRCPFCGSKDVYYFQYYNSSWGVCCNYCCASSSIWDMGDTAHHFSKEEAKNLWNNLKR